jgi:hypothetical protein
MRHELDEVGPPPDGVFRVDWHEGPLDPPPWHKAGSDGTFGNRFDDPSAAEGRPQSERFSCLYCGTTAEAAFGETLAGFRVSIDKLARIGSAVRDAEPLQEIFAGIVDFGDAIVSARGIVPAEWRERRRLARTVLHQHLRFANVATRASNQYLRSVLAGKAAELNLQDVEFSTMLIPNQRKFTQACAANLRTPRC